MNRAHRANADHVGQTGPGVRLLADAGLAPQLTGQLDNLAGPGRSDRMAHGQQPAGRADRAAPANIQPAALQQPGRLALGAQAHGFDIQQLLNAERVVEFDQVEVGRRDTGLVIRLGDRLARQLGVEVCGSAVHPLGPQGRGQNPHGSGPRCPAVRWPRPRRQ